MIIIENQIIKTRFTNNLPKNKDLTYYSKKNRRGNKEKPLVDNGLFKRFYYC